MSDIFVTVPGRMVAIQSSSAQGILFQLAGFEATGVLIGLDTDGSVAAQFQPSLNQSVYITPFGDNVGTVSADLLLNDTCSSSGSSGPGSGQALSSFLSLYSDSRLSPTNPYPVQLFVGRSVFTGFAIKFQTHATSSEGTVIRGTITFAAWLT